MSTEQTTNGAASGGSALNDLLGDWRMMHDTPTRMGISAFTLPKGAIVAVAQIDDHNNKVLVQTGPAASDWMHKTWIEKNCERAA